MSSNNERDIIVHEQHGAPGWVPIAIVILAIVAVGGLVTGIWATTQTQTTRQTLTSDIQTLKQNDEKAIDAANMRLERVTTQNTTLQDDVNTVTKRLNITQGQLKKARADAEQARIDQASKLAAMNDQVNTELSTKANKEDVTAVTGVVTGVRTDLDATKGDLETTKTSLNMARSELGTLIAKNHTEIDELRRLGERDYIEFVVEGKGTEKKVGSVSIVLRGADVNKNQYNLALTVDDKRTEKRNRTINEPIFFYAGGAHQPMEIVVNKVEKNKIVGYLSIPKATQPATASTGTSSNR